MRTGELFVKAARAVRAIAIPAVPVSLCENTARANESKAHYMGAWLQQKEKCSICFIRIL
jgi:hypothetical protein